MRLWSLHPSYLDTKGLVALWREGLLAQKVLSGATKGYRNHPQLIRFKEHPDMLGAISYYLLEVQHEAEQRGFRFDAGKIGRYSNGVKMNVTHGQMLYEFSHLRVKLKQRDLGAYNRLIALDQPLPHPLFMIVDGDVERWEVVR